MSLRPPPSPPCGILSRGKEWQGAPVEGRGSLRMLPATLQPSSLLLATYPKHTWALIQGCVQIILQ